VQKGRGESRVFSGKEIAPPKGMHWIWTQENIDKAFLDGRIMINSKGTPRKIQYLDEMDGDIVSDLWTDIFHINSQAY
jgi:adenine-specific DNA-methyltransferase